MRVRVTKADADRLTNAGCIDQGYLCDYCIYDSEMRRGKSVVGSRRREVSEHTAASDVETAGNGVYAVCRVFFCDREDG